MSRIKALGVAVAAGTISLAAPTIAHAESSSYDDAKGDIFYLQDGSAAPAGTPTVSLDLASTKVKHGRKAISVIGTYHNLKKVDGTLVFGLVVRVKDQEVGLYSGGNLVAGPGNRAGTLSAFHNNETAPCTTTHEIDYRADTISMTFPRACFGKPEWIKADAFAQREVPPSGSEGSYELYYDQGRSAGRAGDYTNRLFRGDGS